MTGNKTRVPRKRKKVVRRKKKTTIPGSSAGADTGGPSDATLAVPAARQVDVAEVTKVSPAADEGGSAHAVKRTARRRSRRSSKASRKRTGSRVDTASADAGSGTAPTKTEKKAAPRAVSRRARRKPRQEEPAPAGEKAAAERKTPRKSKTVRRRAAKEAVESRAAPGDQAAREMLINVSAGAECRIAVLHEGRLEELFIERTATQSHVGNIYKGRVTNVEPSIQAIFVDFGLPQNGFLHISDVKPQYFPDHKGRAEEVGRKIPRYNRPPIQKCFRRGQEVIVQVTKEGVGTKGPTLTTYLSIPGRFLVMMPGMNRHGVSRKIEDEADRRSMRDMLKQLELPSGMGFILRTAGLNQPKRELQRDLHYLLRLWKTVAERIKRLPPPAELYQESDLVTRTIRDIYTAGFKRVIVDEAETAKRAREFLQIAMPRSKTVVDYYSDREPLFHRFGIEEEIEKINMRHVPLPSGGSLVIDTTEALVAIDVNSGRFRTMDDAEETAFQTNLEAVEEIARQLRLRDLGGLIVCDLIDMRLDRHKRDVERALREAIKKHKERAKPLRTNAFGLIEMTRQRRGPSLKRNIYYDCPHCKGSGLVKMPDSVLLDVMRIIQLAAHHEHVHKVVVTVASDVAYQILNSKRGALSQIETETGKQIIVRGDANFTSDQIDCVCKDARGRPVNAAPSYCNGASQINSS
ncbi:MAG: Rne/Rng family ribonuclease [Phycisphaerales bacterium]|nr:MAG: Rne/Rng family ribonuclease [Phycisphaerales bacterium]